MSLSSDQPPADLALRRLRRDNALLAAANYDLEHSRDALAQLTHELERSNRDLESFAAAASHDLAEPLRAIQAFSHRLATRYRGQLDDDADDCLRFIAEASEQMQALIQALLAYSRLNHAELSLELIDTERLVEHHLTTLDCDGHAWVETRGLPQVVADRAQLGQVFQNLLGNALKFVAAGTRPHLRISAGRHGEGWRFDVADNGIGIDPRHADRIFDPFRREQSREDYEGTGIGLAICRSAVERHGGRIWAAPGEDGGSVFSFTLPDLQLV